MQNIKMVKKELIKWIESEEAEGYSAKKLSKYLVEKGYSKDQIKEAMDLTSQKKKPETSFEKVSKPKCTWRYVVLAVILIIIVAGTIMYLSPREKVVEEDIDEPQEIVVVQSPDFPRVQNPSAKDEISPEDTG